MTEIIKLTEEQKQHLEEWCTALESGEYEQGRACLLRHGSYCCLGVACEISDLGEWKEQGLSTSYHIDPVAEHCERGWCSLDSLPSVQEHFGFTSADGFVVPIAVLKKVLGEDGWVFRARQEYATLVALNDGMVGKRGLTFCEIAEVVRAYIAFVLEQQEQA